MYGPERGWSLSFSGCGFLGFYHIGVTRCLSERAPHLVQDARMLFGSSAGALHGVALLSGISLGTYVRGPPPGGAGMGHGHRRVCPGVGGRPSPDGCYLRRVLLLGAGGGGCSVASPGGGCAWPWLFWAWEP